MIEITEIQRTIEHRVMFNRLNTSFFKYLNFSSAPVFLKDILLNNRLLLLNHYEENCKILRNGELIKNYNITLILRYATRDTRDTRHARIKL